MKSPRYPSDVEGVGIGDRKNTRLGILVSCHLGLVASCHLGLVMCEYERGSARTNKIICKKHKPIPHKKTREMGAIYFKRRKHRLTDKELAMLCNDCVSRSMLDRAEKLFMCNETIR